MLRTLSEFDTLESQRALLVAEVVATQTEPLLFSTFGLDALDRLAAIEARMAELAHLIACPSRES